MNRTEEYYKTEIAVEIRRIMKIEKNKETAAKFLEAINSVKPKSCSVKSGWRSGSDIDFTLAFEKNGNKNPFDLFIENIEDKAETHGFICGLYPEIFHFNPMYSLNNETHSYISFKLIKNEE